MTPLAKRLPRELRRNIGKYLGIFLLMCGSIALTSGFLLAAHSIGCLIDDMRDDYTIEDGRVTTSFEATKDQLKAAEDAAEDVGGQHHHLPVRDVLQHHHGLDHPQEEPHAALAQVHVQVVHAV